MTVDLFSVYDSAAERYLEPFWAPSVEYAIRGFRRQVNESETNIARYPEDYTLFHVGTFDQEKGMLTPVEPRSLGVAITFVDRGPELMKEEEKDAV